MYPKHFTEKRCIVLRIPAWFNVTRPLIIAVTPVAGRDVEIVIVVWARTKSDPTAVMVSLRLIERKQGLDVGRGRVGDVRNPQEFQPPIAGYREKPCRPTA